MIDGAGEGGRSPSPRFEAVPEHSAEEAVQLAFPFARSRNATLVSIGLAGLSFEDFLTILDEHEIRVLLDQRVSPLFRGNGFRVGKLHSALQERDIRYLHFPELTNPFATENLKRETILLSYRRSLKEKQSELERLYHLVLDGPLLVLGWAPEHDQSERAVLIDALAEFNSEFDLVVLA